MPTTITRPGCDECWFYIPVGKAVGECREDSPKAGSVAKAPSVPAAYWCGQFAYPPAGSVVTTPDFPDMPRDD